MNRECEEMRDSEKIGYKNFRAFEDKYNESEEAKEFRFGQAFMMLFYPEYTDDSIFFDADYESARTKILERYVRWWEMFRLG